MVLAPSVLVLVTRSQIILNLVSITASLRFLFLSCVVRTGLAPGAAVKIQCITVPNGITVRKI